MFTSVGDRAGRAPVRPIMKLPDVFPSGLTSVTIPIPAGYNNIEIRYYVRSSIAAATQDMSMRFNADGGSNYDANVIYNATATTAASGEALAQTSGLIANIPGSTATANRFASGVIRINNYLGNIGNKVATADDGGAFGTLSNQLINRLWTVIWRSIAPINSVTFIVTTGFANGCKFSTYLYK